MNPIIPPRPDISRDVSYVGVTSRPSSTTSHMSDRSHGPDAPRRRDPPPIPPHPNHDADWEAREEMRVRELEEARARAAQMEKTMRWWSDCTANWREKWSKVRNERNKAREEVRHLRTKLESAMKDSSTTKREKQEMLAELQLLKKQVDMYSSEKEHVSVASSSGSQRSVSDHEGSVEKDSVANSNKSSSENTDFLEKLLSKKDTEERKDADSGSNRSEKSDRRKHMHSQNRKKHDSSVEKDSLVQKVSMLQMMLEEAQKTIQAERDQRCAMVKSMEQLQEENSLLKSKFEEVKEAKEDMSEQLSKVQAEHQEAIGRISMDLEDESNTRSDMDKRLADLRGELERLQAENAQEWGKRERLETEKLVLERENKKLNNEIENLTEELEKKGKQASVHTEYRLLQVELSEKTKEINDLRHNNSKVKKQLQDKLEELEHSCRRSEQYDQEVKRLRSRVEELKIGLANAEDEVDKQANQIRKLQRTNEEVQQQNENLEVQVDHLNTRLKRSSSQTALIRASSLKSFEALEAADLPSDSDMGD